MKAVMLTTLMSLQAAPSSTDAQSQTANQVWLACVMRQVGDKSGRLEGKRSFLGLHMTSQPGSPSSDKAEFEDPSNLRLGANVTKISRNAKSAGFYITGETTKKDRAAVVYEPDENRNFQATLVRYGGSGKHAGNQTYWGSCAVSRSNAEYSALKASLYSELKGELEP